jgi:hypothetical protein
MLPSDIAFGKNPAGSALFSFLNSCNRSWLSMFWMVAVAFPFAAQKLMPTQCRHVKKVHLNVHSFHRFGLEWTQ